MQAKQVNNRIAGWPAWLVLMIGLLVVGLSYWQANVMIGRELAAQLDLRAKEASNSIEREIDAYAETLRGLQAEFLLYPDLSRGTFRQIAAILKLDSRMPGIQAIAFTQRVAPGQAGAFEAAIRREFATGDLGYPAPAIHPPAPAGEAFVVKYHDPIDKNRANSWYDQASEPKRRAAIERARDTGALSTSGRVTQGDSGLDSVIFFLPVYSGGVVPATLEQRRAAFLGAVFAVVRVDEMLRKVFGPALLEDLDIEIYDMQGAAPGRHDQGNLIFDSGGYQGASALHADDRAFPLHRRGDVDVGGSAWHVHITALPAFVQRSQSWLPPIAAVVGVLLTLLVFYFLRVLELSRQALRAHARSVEATAHLHLRAIEACANAIIVTSAQGPDYAIEYVNGAFERITGYTAGEVIGRSARMFHGDDGDQPGLDEIRGLVHERREGHAVVRNYRKDGTLYWSEVHIAPVKDADDRVSHYVAAKYDVTAARKYQAELEFHATRDSLTGLANRNLLRDRLAQAIAYANRYEHAVWVVFVDLDRFKFVIDTLGQAAGDALLKAVAERLLAQVRETDTVARLVGDQFVLVLAERGDEALSALAVQRIVDAVTEPLTLAGHEFFPGCAVGVAAYPGDGDDADTLIRHAGVAVYRSREIGGDQFQFYTPAMNQRSLERLRLERDLRGALAGGQFLLHYQPQLDLRTGRIVGMEALLRWRHPEFGMVMPSEFIGLAEETGMIVPIGAWVLRTACLQNKAWQDAGLGALRVAVNLSVRQFRQADLVESVAAALEETGLEPHYLDIELTESLVMGDVEQAVRILGELKKLGVRLSIDDFGTGYSSLSYLKRFPVDVLKIDQSFVREITTSADDAAIARSVISMAHSLRLEVIAEGVETLAQLMYLRRQGCDQMQGFYFSRPLAADAFGQILQERKSLSAELGGENARRQTLLIVDDDANIASSLQRLLRLDGYQILKAQSVFDAFDLLALHPVQVIICDQRMPEMSGTEFLFRIKELYPETIRIMLSGYTCLDSVIDTINRGAIYRFFTKPWDDEVLRDNIREAFRHYWLLHGAGAAPAGVAAEREAGVEA
jgi:diguanylate cyclase (GGDEF)-like protein/PAS domain S-box-containing protein